MAKNAYWAGGARAGLEVSIDMDCSSNQRARQGARCALDVLPAELLPHVVKLLPVGDLGRAETISRALRAAVERVVREKAAGWGGFGTGAAERVAGESWARLSSFIELRAQDRGGVRAVEATLGRAHHPSVRPDPSPHGLCRREHAQRGACEAAHEHGALGSGLTRLGDLRAHVGACHPERSAQRRRQVVLLGIGARDRTRGRRCPQHSPPCASSRGWST